MLALEDAAQSVDWNRQDNTCAPRSGTCRHLGKQPCRADVRAGTAVLPGAVRSAAPHSQAKRASIPMAR